MNLEFEPTPVYLFFYRTPTGFEPLTIGIKRMVNHTVQILDLENPENHL